MSVPATPANAKPTLQIEVNNVRSRILFEDSLYNDYFQNCMYAVDNNTAFLLPNCEINKDYNTRLPDGSRKWDGKKHLFNPLPYTKYGLRPFEFYSGKIRQVIEVLFRYGYQIKLIHNRKQPQINERNWSWNPKYTLYDYQQTIVADAAKKGRGIVKLATGGGKTIIGAGIMHRLGVAPFVFFVTSKDLLYQAKESFEDIFQMPIGVIGDGICDIQEINVCTIQTCVVAFGRMDVFEDQCKKLKTVTEDTLLDKSEKTVSADRYELIRNVVRSAKGIIFDEIHHSASDTCVMILEFCESAYFRYGLGATVERDDKMEGMIEGLFGDYICNITPSFLIKRGQLISPHIYMIPIDKYMGECESYPSEYKTYITENEFRNDAIARIAQETVKANMPTLILVKQLKHGSALKELIPGSEFIQGQVNATKRKELIQKMRDRKLLCVIATSLADEGLDVTSLECLILAGSGKSIVKAMQRIGRVIRIDKSNPSKRAIVYDFIDSSPILHSHALKRKKLYTSESEFNVYDFRYKKYIEQAALTKGLFDAQ